MLLLLAIGAALLGATWVAYPALMAVLARGRRAPRAALRAPVPRCTVVLASREPEEAIRARLRNLFETEYPADHLEIVVALDHGGSPDGRDELSQLDSRVQTVHAAWPGGKACALNAGVAAGTGEVLVFADTYQRFEPDTIPLLVGAVQEPGVGAASGRLVLPDTMDQTLLHYYWDLEVRLREHEAAVHSSVGVFGPVYAMRQEYWTPLPPRLILDDLYGPMQVVLAGGRVTFVPEATAHDLRSPDPVREYWRKARTLAGNIQLWRWLPAVLHPGKNPIWACFVAHKVLRFLTPIGILALALGSLGLMVRTLSPTVLAVVAGVLVLVVLFTGRRLQRQVGWGVHMVAAILAGVYYGVRGEWDVWRR